MIHIVQHMHLRIYTAVFIALLFTGFYDANGFLFYPIFHVPVAGWVVFFFILCGYRPLLRECKALVQWASFEQAQPKLKMIVVSTLLFFTHIVVYAFIYQQQPFGTMYPYFCAATGMYAVLFAYLYKETTEKEG